MASATTTSTSAIERPRQTSGPIHWLRQNLFRTWFDTILTFVVAVVVLLLLARFIEWATVQAQWAVITANFRVLMQGLYPPEQSWRLITCVILITLLAGISWGVWGRLLLRSAIILSVGAALIVLLPIVIPSLGDASPLARYFSNQLIPLLDVLKGAVLTLVVSLFVGYGVGRLGINVNRNATRRIVSILWLISIPVIFILIRGLTPNTPALPLVPTSAWGGLLLTFMMAFVAIVGCFPLGVLLALGRTSSGSTPKRPELPQFWFINPRQWYVASLYWWRTLGPFPIIKLFCVLYIEFFRGIPLVTVFFTANLLAPLALGSTELDAVVRGMIGLTLFEAAYIAEIVRGGLQSLPAGQLEAAKALGLSPIQATALVTMPQALRVVIPALVGQFITMFKDTSLVVVVGLLDLLGIAQGVLAQQAFSGRQREMYVFVAVVYFVFSFGMSRAARQLERSGSGGLQFNR
jgi:general L-amino acid transport system permease protein